MGKTFSCFCGKMCYELWHGAWERRSEGFGKDSALRGPNGPSLSSVIMNDYNKRFFGSKPSPYELGDLDAWGHQVRILEDIDDFADRDAWEAVA